LQPCINPLSNQKVSSLHSTSTHDCGGASWRANGNPWRSTSCSRFANWCRTSLARSCRPKRPSSRVDCKRSICSRTVVDRLSLQMSRGGTRVAPLRSFRRAQARAAPYGLCRLYSLPKDQEFRHPRVQIPWNLQKVMLVLVSYLEQLFHVVPLRP